MHGYTLADRHERQERIIGWDQSKLAQARILVLGAGPLGQLVGVGLAALGVGTIHLVDGETISEEGGTLLRLVAPGGASRAHALATLLRQIDPDVQAIPHGFAVRHEVALGLMPVPTLVIDASNDGRSKRAALRYAMAQQIPGLLGAAKHASGLVSVYLPGRPANWSEAGQGFEEYGGEGQSWAPSMVIAGLILEEVRKCVMPLDEEEFPVEHPLVYNRQSANRFDRGKDFALGPETKYRGHALVVGAGALGTWLSLALALNSIEKLTIVDPQAVDSTNLNRQVLYHDSVGEYKAIALTEKLRRINPRVEYEALVDSASEEYFEEHAPDVIFAAVDNFQGRELLNRVATRRRIPLISGGTNAHAGQFVAYVPGQTACLECQLSVSHLALEEQERERRAGCAHEPQPSIAATNALIGGLMAAEAGPVLAPAVYGQPVKGIIEYRSRQPERIGIHSCRQACDCHEKSGT